MLTFVYLDVGSRKLPHLRPGEFGIEIETQYSISTLKADKSADHRIAIYTDQPDRYSNCGIDVVDISEIGLTDLSFPYRAKPAVLLHAMRLYGGICTFIDSDTYIMHGFSAAVTDMASRGAVLWEFDLTSPKSHFPPDIPACPHSATHKPSPRARPEGNSGVIGLKAGSGEAILEDALHLIDVMRARGNRVRTLEQTAIFEAVWLSGMAVYESKPWVDHYCTQSRKRYMHWQIKRLLKQQGRPLRPAPPSITITSMRVKLYQYYWDIRRRLTPKQPSAMAG